VKSRLVRRAMASLALAVPIATFLLVAGLAHATDRPGYQGAAGGVQGSVSGGGALPFTGLDLGLLVGGGMVLLVVGGLLRRLAREKQ